MLIIFIAIINQSTGLKLGSSLDCDCTELMTEYDCQQNYCNWQEGYCFQYNCTQVYNQTTCEKAINCAWQNNTCTIFSQCSNYAGYKQSDCNVYGFGCSITTDPIGSQYKCATLEQPIVDCQSYKNLSQCTLYGTNVCVFVQSNQTCRDASCEDYILQSDCTFSYAGNLLDPVLCEWNASTNSCADAHDTSYLNSNTCYINTKGKYYWNPLNSSCLDCIGSPLSVQVYQLLIILNFLILLLF